MPNSTVQVLGVIDEPNGTRQRTDVINDRPAVIVVALDLTALLTGCVNWV